MLFVRRPGKVFSRRGLRMDESNDSALRYPQAHCVFCCAKTPHIHERLAVQGRQVVRSLCLVCRREQPKGGEA